MIVVVFIGVAWGAFCVGFAFGHRLGVRKANRRRAAAPIYVDNVIALRRRGEPVAMPIPGDGSPRRYS